MIFRRLLVLASRPGDQHWVRCRTAAFPPTTRSRSSPDERVREAVGQFPVSIRAQAGARRSFSVLTYSPKASGSALPWPRAPSPVLGMSGHVLHLLAVEPVEVPLLERGHAGERGHITRTGHE